MSRIPDSPPPYDTVVFDCDSTLSAIEGIDELAGPRRAEIAALTARAMAGEVPLEDVYGLRLDLLKPTRASVDAVGRQYVDRALPHGRDLVDALHALEKRVVVVSGGLRPAVLALARELGIADADVHAVDARFDAKGAWASYDEASPLARSGGKPLVMRTLPGNRRVLVGDGASDLEAAPECARFIAFGGVERRESVFRASVATCDEPDLAALVPLLLSPSELGELERRPEHAPLLAAARRYARS